MKRKRAALLLVVFLCGLLVTGGVLAMSSLSYAVPWRVIGGGGGYSQSSGYRLNGTIGQGVVGSSTSANYRLRSGFWAGVPGAAANKLYLPVVLRNLS